MDVAQGEWLSRTEAARRLGIHPNTLDRWVTRGLVIKYIAGGTVRFKISEIDAVYVPIR